MCSLPAGLKHSHQVLVTQEGMIDARFVHQPVPDRSHPQKRVVVLDELDAETNAMRLRVVTLVGQDGSISRRPLDSRNDRRRIHDDILLFFGLGPASTYETVRKNGLTPLA